MPAGKMPRGFWRLISSLLCLEPASALPPTGRLFLHPISIFFYDLKFQVIKINILDKIVLCKACFAVSFEVSNVFVQPDGVPQVKLAAGFIQGMEDFVGAGVRAGVFNAGVMKHTIVFKGSSP